MNLGDRMKQYERTFQASALRRTPLVIRVDGRAFHTLTRKMRKPFDGNFITAMTVSAKYVAEQMQGFKAAYVQSDEATFLLTDYDAFETDGWFNYEIPKVISISAALMSVMFNTYTRGMPLSVFDSRAFSVPLHDAVNCFLWRAKDWERNSLQMYARSKFSHNQLKFKNHAQIHEMLFSIGANWATDLTDQEKNGTFLLKTPKGICMDCTIKPTFESVNAAIWPLINIGTAKIEKESEGK